MVKESDLTGPYGLFRLVCWVVVAAFIFAALAGASVTAAAQFPNSILESVLAIGGVATSFVLGLVVVNRGFRGRTNSITPLFVGGVCGYVFLVLAVLYRMALIAIINSGKLDL